jgi:hypothetical protein
MFSCKLALSGCAAVLVDCVWNVMAHAQKPDFVFRRKGRVHLNRRGRQFSRLLAAEVCASAVVMLDTPCSEVVWRVLATHFIHQFSLHFPSRASQCAIRFQMDSNFIANCYISSNFSLSFRIMRTAPYRKFNKNKIHGKLNIFYHKNFNLIFQANSRAQI